MNLTNRLIPPMRAGIEVIKMVMFKKLREQLGRNHPEQDSIAVAKLTGAIINELFGTPNHSEPFATFAATNRDSIRAELKALAQTLPEMKIPLTDALRMQVLCDLQEGRDGSPLLGRARELNLLSGDRELPMPHTFMDLARRLGKAFDLIVPPLPSENFPEPITK